MKYLFFDIECSNNFNGVGKMCEFGYVLMDEQFKITKLGDIPMSPGRGSENRFYLKGRKGEKDLELAYEYDFYLSQPEFRAFYNQIKRLMEDPDTVCFAYSMDNDIRHLFNSCRRYKLEQLNYTCYDVQKLVSRYLERKGQIGLKNACLEIVGPKAVTQLQEHLSRDDAQMEKLIFEAICIFEKKTPEQLLAASEFAKANSIEFVQRVEERKEKKKHKNDGYDLYKSLVCNEAELDEPKNFGRRYSVSNKLKTNLDTLNSVINAIKERNGLFSNTLEKTDIFVALDEKNKESIIKNLQKPFEGRIVTFEELIMNSTINS